jgi:D-3-phosphoglycerate dehydrogenase
MEKAKNLKVISRCGIGTDAVDLEAAKDLGIKVTITPQAPMVSVAELTLGLMLSLLRRINTNDSLIRSGKWKGPSGNLLSGKTVGIIGCGRIGSYVARLVTAFGCKTIGYDPFIKMHDVCEMMTLDELIQKADIITLHVPYSKENHYMINEERLKSMKKSALLVNVARGGLIDEEALYNALKNGEIAGAALDCFEVEPYIGKLAELDNTVFTPHMGSSASEGRLLMEKEAVDNLINEL